MVGVIEVLQQLGLALDLNGKLFRRLGILKYLAKNVQTFVVAARAGNNEWNILFVLERRGEALIVMDVP